MGALTPNLGLTVPTIGGDGGPAFAQYINGDLNILDTAYGGINAIGVGGSSNVTATTAQAQNLIQQLTGALTGNITYFLPAVGGYYAIENQTTGSFTLSVGCTGGANTLTVPQGLSMWVWTDGSLIRTTAPQGWQLVSTYTVSGVSTFTILLPAAFRRFRLTCQTMAASTTTQVLLQLSSDGGSTFLTTSTYTSLGTTVGPITAVAGFVAPNITSWVLSGAAITGGSTDASFEIYPGTAAASARYRGSAIGFISGGAQYFDIGGYVQPTAVANAARIVVPAGTLSGTFIVEGLV